MRAAGHRKPISDGPAKGRDSAALWAVATPQAATDLPRSSSTLLPSSPSSPAAVTVRPGCASGGFLGVGGRAYSKNCRPVRPRIAPTFFRIELTTQPT